MAVKTSWSSGDVLTAADLTDTFAAKADLDGATYTGTHDFTGATVSGAGSVTLLVSETLSAASSFSLNDVFTTDFDNYIFHLRFFQAAGLTLSVRFRASGSDQTGANYNYVSRRISSSDGTDTTNYSRGATSLYLCNIGSAAQASFTGFIRNPADTNQTAMSFSGLDLSTGNYFFGGGSFESATAVDGLTIYTDTSTILPTIRIYGYAND